MRYLKNHINYNMNLADPSGGVPPAPSPFAFSDIADLEFDFDASITGGIWATGGAVSDWDELSINEKHGTQGLAADRPTTGIRTENGLNAVDFAGTSLNQHLILPTKAIPKGANTIISVYRPDNTATGTILSNWGGIRFLNQAVLPVGASIISRPVPTADQLIIQVYRVSGSTDTETHRLKINDDAEISTIDNGAGYGTFSFWHMGTYHAAFTAFDGGLCQLAAFSRDISDAEVNEACNAMLTKWGGTWSDV